METQHLNRLKIAREKYKPAKISCLFIAEAPPSDPGRFFYFEEVREQDFLYLEMMKVLFKETTQESEEENPFRYIFGFEPSTSDLRNNKESYLNKFKDKGYYLIDTLDSPMPYHISRTQDKIKFLEGYKVNLTEKVKQLIDKKTPIVLISVPVFQAYAGTLKYNGFNVIHNEPIEFPGSGQQKKFKEKMEKLTERLF